MKRIVSILSLAVAPLIGACGPSDIVGPEADAMESFVQSLDVQSFQSLMIASAAQVEVELLPGGLTASELSVRPSGKSDGERVQSRAVAITSSGGAGTLSLLMGELHLSFNADTRFWFGDDQVGMEDFVAEVRGAIAEGHEPAIVAERPAPAVAQAPDDASFLARDIALTGDGSSRLRMEVDGDNLQLVTDRLDGDPDGWLLVLGLRIQLRVSDGTTELESHDHDFEHVEEFEGHVTRASLDAFSFTLDDGTTVRVVDRTVIAQGDGFISGLAGVAEAIAAGQDVVAWGKGAVESEDPLVLIALKVAFKVREAEEPALHEFEGVVGSVQLDAGQFTLGDGTIVRVVDLTELIAYNDDSPATLAGVAEAIAEGFEVVAWGKGQVESEDPIVIEAARVVFKVRVAEDHREEFEGTVVEATAGRFALEDGTEVVVTDDTEIVAYHDYSPVTLETVIEALERGRNVFAWGVGTVETTEPRIVIASRVVFKTVIEDFEKDVAEIDVDGGVIVLEGGWVVELSDETELLAADDVSPNTLQGAAEALAAGDRVRAWGLGFVTGREPVVLDAIRVTLRRIPAG